MLGISDSDTVVFYPVNHDSPTKTFRPLHQYGEESRQFITHFDRPYF